MLLLFSFPCYFDGVGKFMLSLEGVKEPLQICLLDGCDQ